MALPTQTPTFNPHPRPHSPNSHPLERFGCPRHPTAALCPAPQHAPPRPPAPLPRTVTALEGARRSRPRRGGGSSLAEARSPPKGTIPLRETLYTFDQMEPPRADRILATPPRAAVLPPKALFFVYFFGPAKKWTPPGGHGAMCGAQPRTTALGGRSAAPSRLSRRRRVPGRDARRDPEQAGAARKAALSAFSPFHERMDGLPRPRGNPPFDFPLWSVGKSPPCSTSRP
ncbi:hypothetical protein DND132_2607 [Pseudodesulfovibrio mercurii]|uniref:Uncharacterized protein n=1 Tax=Pseudodesulfovibrio mercurii TaxID=641491 RepID=F0JDD6_9BACT|nr:hypothetical protein DND132_2607 [Pseudodesulfovibrio mercurii]